MRAEPAPSATGTVALSFAELVLAAGKAPISGEVQQGEIVGLAGLEGQGQEAFMHVLAGLAPPLSGTAWIGAPGGVRIVSHAQVARNRVAYLPRDRQTMGTFPALSVLDNFGLPSMPAFSRFGILDRRRQRRSFTKYAEFLDLRYPDAGAPITALSGGNQQKVLLARWLALEPRAMLLNDPTRGVDLNTRLKLYDAFRELATGTSAVALVILSSEIEEILQICDRVLVFRDFEVHRTIARAEMTMDGVLAAMFGQEAAR